MDADSLRARARLPLPIAFVCVQCASPSGSALLSSSLLSFPFQVAQYINFHFSFLESILQRLDEEEKRETERIMAK